MGILNWLMNTSDPATQRIGEKVETIMSLQPNLRLARRYHARLDPAVAASVQYLEDLIDSLPEPCEASTAAWASNPCIRAFFVRAEDVTEIISRSSQLRAYFEENPDVEEVYAVLGMEMVERHILGVGMVGDAVRRDIPQTTLSFTDHQVRMCERSPEALKSEIIRLMLEQLALEGMARNAEGKHRRDELEHARALLKTRLSLLQHQGAGMQGMFGSGAPVQSSEVARLQAEIEANAHDLANLGMSSDALDRELDTIRDVLLHPQLHIYLSHKRIRLDHSNVVIEENGASDGAESDFHFARIPGNPPRTRAFAMIRFARRDLLPEKSMTEEAARLLGGEGRYH